MSYFRPISTLAGLFTAGLLIGMAPRMQAALVYMDFSWTSTNPSADYSVSGTFSYDAAKQGTVIGVGDLSSLTGSILGPSVNYTLAKADVWNFSYNSGVTPTVLDTAGMGGSDPVPGNYYLLVDSSLGGSLYAADSGMPIADGPFVTVSPSAVPEPSFYVGGVGLILAAWGVARKTLRR